jgi:hypothetical protein
MDPQPAGDHPNKKRRLALARLGPPAGVLCLALALWGGYVYTDHEERKEIRERKAPLAEVIVLSMYEAEPAIKARGGRVAGDAAPRPACSLATCADAKAFAVSPEGGVSVVLSGGRQPALEDLAVVLTPTITKDAVTWTCKTNAPPAFVPVEGESGFRVPCTALDPAAAAAIVRSARPISPRKGSS